MTPFRLLAATAVALACAASVQARTWKQVFPLHGLTTSTIASEGVTVTVAAPPPCPGDCEVSDDAFAAKYADATITVSFPGTAPFVVPRDEHRSTPYGISVGIGRMAPGDAAPTVLLGGYTGGAHCCATLQVVSLVDGQPVVAVLPMKDGEPLERFPRDIDGDGTADIRWTDDSLLYQFASHASSWQVPRIYNLAAGKAVVVSREPRYAGVFRDFARETLASCRKGTSPENGDCAAYAYAMAILGQTEEGIRAATSFARTPDPLWLPQDCSVPYDANYECPEGKAITFDGFEPALRYLMRKNGYLQ
jgi:hypothetical protein